MGRRKGSIGADDAMSTVWPERIAVSRWDDEKEVLSQSI